MSQAVDCNLPLNTSSSTEGLHFALPMFVSAAVAVGSRLGNEEEDAPGDIEMEDQIYIQHLQPTSHLEVRDPESQSDGSDNDEDAFPHVYLAQAKPNYIHAASLATWAPRGIQMAE